jgi:signal transduction histidine kinase
MFSIRVMAVEALVTLSSIVVFVNAATAPTMEYTVISFLSLFLIAPMGIYLIHNVKREAQEKERLDNVNRELAVANAQLKEMDQIKNEFITMASHQLRTPISVVKGYLSLMLEDAYGAVPGPIRDKLQQIYGLNERLVQMIDNMLNAARIEKRKIEYVVVRSDVLSAVRKVMEEMRIKAEAKSLTLKSATPNQPIMAYFDEDKLHEVLVNLVDNAIKYTDAGEVTVGVSEAATEGFVAVTVRDSGIGMTKEEASRVFTKFFRAKEAVIREPGTGLGLFICAKFMNGMGGEIGVVETEAGKGTVFGLKLPVSKPDLEGDAA